MFVFFVDFAPWLFWWVLVGNVRTPVTAALVALGTALALVLMGLLQRRGLQILPIGSGVVFAVIPLLGLVIGEARLLPWVQLIARAGACCSSSCAPSRPAARSPSSGRGTSSLARSSSCPAFCS